MIESMISEDVLQDQVNKALALFLEEGLSLAQVVIVADEVAKVSIDALKESIGKEGLKPYLKVIEE